jgi:hypothetical protein
LGPIRFNKAWSSASIGQAGRASHFGLLSDPSLPGHEVVVKDAQAAASAIGGSIEVLPASTSSEIDAVFAHIANEKHV